MERISHAAILVPHMIVFGRSHYEAKSNLPSKTRFENRNCGFLTSEMRFVFREDAKRVALAAGQITEAQSSKTFISERLWSEREGGIHIYDEVNGYMPRNTGSPEGDADAK